MKAPLQSSHVALALTLAMSLTKATGAAAEPKPTVAVPPGPAAMPVPIAAAGGAGNAVPLDIPELQRAVEERPAAAAAALEAAVEQNPDNAYWLYNHGVAAYAAGKYDDALVSLDRVENLGNKRLARRAKFQKGNTEYRAGLAARQANLDETIYRWKQSLENYRGVLEEQPGDERTQTNFKLVQSQLLTLLLEQARKNEDEARKATENPPRRLENLRNAHDKYTEATKVDPSNEPAKKGEESNRQDLAQELSKQGWEKASAEPQPRFNPREPSLPDFDTRNLAEGMRMLEDANGLTPENTEIQERLEKARDFFANAQTKKAKSYMDLEQRVGLVREKLAILRMAREIVEKALDQRPKHELAQKTLAEINRRLAQIHEEEADQLTIQSDFTPDLENQAMQLSEAMDHLQQAQELAPEKKSLPLKAQQTGDKLAAALEKLGDKLMKSPGKESLEQQIGRLEGAQQALDQLMGMKPSPGTQGKSEKVGKELEGLRGQMGEKGMDGEKPGGEGQPKPVPGQGQMAEMGFPLDARPRINQPGQNGPRESPEKNARKY